MLVGLASCEQNELATPETGSVELVEFSDEFRIPVVNGKLRFADRVELDKVLDLGGEFVNETLTDHNFVSYHDVYEDYNKQLDQAELLPAELDHDIVLELPEEAEGWFERIVPAIGVGMLVNADREVLVGDTLFQVGYDDMSAVVVDAELNPVIGTETTITYPIMGQGGSGVASRSQCGGASGGWHTSPSITGSGCVDRRIRMKFLAKAIFRERLEVVSETRREKGRTFGKNCKFTSTTEDQAQTGEMHGTYPSGLFTETFSGRVDKPRQRDNSLYSSVPVPGGGTGGIRFNCGLTVVTATMWYNGQSVSITQ